MLRRFTLLTPLAVFAALGCHAQVPPPTSHVVNLSWNAPTASSTWTGCTAANPCTYAVYRCSSTCSDTTKPAWTEVTNPNARPSGLTFVDPTASGLTVNYIVETVQGGANSAPSNTTTVTVPGIPLAPAVSAPTVASTSERPVVNPFDAKPQLAELRRPGAVRLVATIGR